MASWRRKPLRSPLSSGFGFRAPCIDASNSEGFCIRSEQLNARSTGDREAHASQTNISRSAAARGCTPDETHKHCLNTASKIKTASSTETPRHKDMTPFEFALACRALATARSDALLGQWRGGHGGAFDQVYSGARKAGKS